MAQVKKTHQANEDLYEIWHYIAIENQNPENAERFIDSIDKALYTLAQNTKIGSAKNEYQKGLRQFAFKKYLIFYFPLKNGIEVIRIIHGARDLGKQFE